MSAPRKPVPSLGYSGEFYADEIQAVMRRAAKRLPPAQVFRTFFLLSGTAWADLRPPTAPVGSKFLDAYLEDRLFFAELLAAIEAFRAKPAPQSVLELALRFNGLFASSYHDALKVKAGILQHQDIARLIELHGANLGANVSTDRIKSALSREGRRRAKIDSDWGKLVSKADRRAKLSDRKRGKASL